MMKVQRRFGKFLPRTADEAQVSVLLKDYEDADQLLAKIIDASKAWRDAWLAILTTQTNLIDAFHTLYNPIIGASESYDAPQYAVTDESTLDKTAKLKELYGELKTDLLEEVNMVDMRLVKPAMDVKDSIQPMKKIIKKREDRKLDFERYSSRVDVMRKKQKRSERDNMSLAKSENDLARATEEYNTADDHLKSVLPPVITASFSILPHLLASQILIQNTLLAQYYTALHNYCGEEGFQSPPPPMEDVIRTWDADFMPTKFKVETSFNCIATGKAVKQPLKFEDQKGSTMTGLNIRNGINQRRTGSQATPRRPSNNTPALQALPAPPSPEPEFRPRIESAPSSTIPSRPKTESAVSSSSLAMLTPSSSLSDARSTSPGDGGYRAGAGGAHSPAAPRTDYFTRDRQASASTLATQAAIAAKKKPPPRPPPKKNPSNLGMWVTALYSFEGQSDGDLAFQEGDKIRVVKKTGSTDDWWEGELMGKTGAFPANYVQVG